MLKFKQKSDARISMHTLFCRCCSRFTIAKVSVGHPLGCLVRWSLGVTGRLFAASLGSPHHLKWGLFTIWGCGTRRRRRGERGKTAREGGEEEGKGGEEGPPVTGAMRQRKLGSHTPPCHRRMVITTLFIVFLAALQRRLFLYHTRWLLTTLALVPVTGGGG